MRQATFEPTLPIDSDGMPWIPAGPGKWFRPLRFTSDGWSEVIRLEPGSTVTMHRHTGEVHAINLAGTREIFGTGERVGPGNYVYEPAGTVDGWGAIGDEPCVVHIKVTGSIEYLGGNGQVIESVNAESRRARYLTWCREHGVRPAEQILGRSSGTSGRRRRRR